MKVDILATFKEVAQRVLEESGIPMHVNDITKTALEREWLITEGKTPESTMFAQLITDINNLGNKSRFIKTGPSTFSMNPDINIDLNEAVKIEEQISIQRQKVINASISSKQKGDIAEARIAELITLYGDTGLSCYKPISDDEGIDIIVKERGSLKTLYIQVKSRWQNNKGSMIVDVKKKAVVDNYQMGLVVCLFDTDEGDIWDYVWFIPAPDFIKLANQNENREYFRFIAGKNTDREGRWDKYLIDKRDLANKLIEQMKRL